jgi:hypothetical protein
MNFCDGSIRIQSGVEDVERRGIPASAGSTSLERIAAAAYDPPGISRVTNPVESIQRVEQRGVAWLPCRRHRRSSADNHR